MPCFVALLRGINVGKATRVPMAGLRDLLVALDYGNVGTLLNSGNAVFSSDSRAEAAHADRIQAALDRQLGVDVPVIVKSRKTMAAVEDGNRIGTLAGDPSRLLVAFTREARALRELEALSALVRPPEQLLVGEHAAYLWCPDGILASKAAAALLGKAGRAVTTRNWATVLRINALLKGGS